MGREEEGSRQVCRTSSEYQEPGETSKRWTSGLIRTDGRNEYTQSVSSGLKRWSGKVEEVVIIWRV